MTGHFLHIAVCTFAFLASAGAQSPVVLTETPQAFTLSNEHVAARIDRRTGELTSLRYRDLEMISRGYWSFGGTEGRLAPAQNSAVRIDPAANAGERGEVIVRLAGDGKPGMLPLEGELRYALGRGESGLHVSAVWSHRAGQPAMAAGEGRWAMKLNPRIFDFLTIDEERRRGMPSGADWDAGQRLDLKEARRMITGVRAGQVEHKYDYSAVLAETPAWGWTGSSHGVGLWMINPSGEYIAGGPTKVELTGHLDVNPGGVPVLLNMWLGSHYGGSSFRLAREEEWSKQVGPFFIFCNAGSGHEAMWRDALVRAEAERSRWPEGEGGRAMVSGRIVFQDPGDAGVQIANFRVGLTPVGVDWQREGKGYQFWTRADSEGAFTIPHVRPGTWSLHAFADGVPGEFAKADIIVAAGQALDLGTLSWTAERTGRTLWQIGLADRTAAEFRHGDDYWQHGLPAKYAEEFPRDVRYIIGTSDPRRDWNAIHPPRRMPDGRIKSTTWTIEFDLPTPLSGTATLRLGIAGSRAPRGIEMSVNGKPAGNTGPLPDTGVMHRDGIRGAWCERRLAFPAAQLHAGKNLIALRIPAATWVEGVLYDFVRLEVAEEPPPASP